MTLNTTRFSNKFHRIQPEDKLHKSGYEAAVDKSNLRSPV